MFLDAASLRLDAVILGVNLAAAVLIFVGFWLYNRGNHKISTGTWFILASGEFLDLGSYWDMVGGDFAQLMSQILDANILALRFEWSAVGEEWVKSIVPAAFAIGTIATFVVAVVRRRFAWPDANDWFIIILDALITWYWVATDAVTTTNLLFQCTTIMAFIPMYRALHSGEDKETFWPWALWTLAYAGFLGTALMSFGNEPAELAYPTVGLLTHFIVICYVLRKR